MKNVISFLLLICTTSLISRSQEIKESRISGIIMYPTESAIQIGNQTVPIAEDGKFTYTKELESPILLDVSYANLDWTLLLIPDCSINVLIREKNIETIEYTGDLASSNTYLLETNSMSNEVNSSLNKGIPISKPPLTSQKSTIIASRTSIKETSKFSLNFLYNHM